MPFGISSAPEEFQRRLEECLEGLEQIKVITDDIVVYGQGNTDEEADVSHGQAFRALLDRCRECHLKLNPKKLKFKMCSLIYMGHILSDQGLVPDAKKVRAINDMWAGIAERVSALDWLSLRYTAIITLPVSNPGLCP